MSDDTPEQDRFVWARAEWDSFENPEDRDLSYVQEDVQSVLARTKKAEARVMELEKERAAGLEVIRKHAETIRQTIKRAEEAEADVVRARMMVDSSHEMLFTRMEAAEARVVELEKAARDLADSVTRYCAMKDGHISRVTIDRLQDQRLQMRRLARKAQEI